MSRSVDDLKSDELGLTILKCDLELGAGREIVHALIRHSGGRTPDPVLEAALIASHHSHGRHLRDLGERGVGCEIRLRVGEREGE